ECPTPITNLTWDNALLVSDATAKKLGIGQPQKLLGVPYFGNADLVTVTVDGRSLEVPVWVSLGMADDVAVLHMGYGRTKAGMVGSKRSDKEGGGFDGMKLRTSAKPYVLGKCEIAKTGKTYPLANTQFHNTIDTSVVDSDRFLIRETTVGLLASGKPFGGDGPEFYFEKHAGGKDAKVDAHGGDDPKGSKDSHAKMSEGEREDTIPPTMYSESEFDFSATNYQWAMTIDLSLCTGCNACVMACNIENNIPTVGKEQVMKGRELHWMRIDRYYKGTFEGVDLTGVKIDRDNPPIVIQPVTCMHCEKAPCEPVCPVAATVHSHEGLNQMVYNRCVGTRYCSNNCPFKVRRFNFLHYTKNLDQVPVLQMLQNPDVTVRGRGVMEKCTYCVQRINKARITAKKETREIADGEVLTACQVACPGQAIIFGDMRKPENAIAKSRADQRNYVLLKELNVRPRTSYLSKVRNPHPDLEA
ncbi:MAG: 4Fe-4S dicluster domain-containing protein, partial [Fimbriimonadaceae bacterium]|nr:4Fe-4S dicluster domain-containing protein [Fimbriimonadaceae bacterium]